ncbi:MAG: Gfo/Idh/MocA family protein [Phycisphaerales bacterium]
MARPLNIALIGTKFMGRAHSNAWLKVNRFFAETPREAHMHTVCGRDANETPKFAEQWGWAQSSTDWKSVVRDDEIDLVDIGTPNDLHAEQAIAALEAGKHVACEKPLAGSIDDARQMLAAAKKAKKSRTFVWYNYRRCPAVALAHQLVKAGRLGRLYHVRAAYLQEWGGPDTPLLWRFRGKVAGSGAHGDLNAHIIDMARFITGDEVSEVVGAIEETFIKQRFIPDEGGAEIKGSSAKRRGKRRMGRSTVDDAVLFLARFKKGAVASFEATRLATGNKNRNEIEINGEKGAIRFNFERMNELEFYDATTDAKTRGWTTIMCTDGAEHPYCHAWWPDAHIIGYEHGFINQAADILRTLSGRKPEVPLPDFADAFKTQLVLEAAIISARERRPVKIKELA